MMRLLGGKKRLSWLKEAKSIVLPKKGFLRLFDYFRHRAGRFKASPYSISAGFACGVAISFTPLIGVHIFSALFLARLLRGNLVFALIGTLVGNPWTFPLIWLMTYHIGVYFMGKDANQVSPLDILDENGGFFDSLLPMLFNIDALLIPMLVGSMPFVIIAGLGSFALCYLSISKYKESRANRKRKKHGDTK